MGETAREPIARPPQRYSLWRVGTQCSPIAAGRFRSFHSAGERPDGRRQDEGRDEEALGEEERDEEEQRRRCEEGRREEGRREEERRRREEGRREEGAGCQEEERHEARAEPGLHEGDDPERRSREGRRQ